MMRTSLGVIALLAGIAVALLFLNNALFSFWVAGVPHGDENPEGWTFRGVSQLARAAAAMLGGIAVFIAAKRRARAAWVLAGVATLFFLLPWAREFLAADDCLDSGGSWSKTELRCHR